MKRHTCAMGALKRTLEIEDEGKEKVVDENLREQFKCLVKMVA